MAVPKDVPCKMFMVLVLGLKWLQNNVLTFLPDLLPDMMLIASHKNQNISQINITFTYLLT